MLVYQLDQLGQLFGEPLLQFGFLLSLKAS